MKILDSQGRPQGISYTGGGSGTGTIDLAALPAKTTPVNADLMLLGDSSTAFSNAKVTWSNIKTTLKAYFDTIYQTINAALTEIAGLSPSNDDFIQRKGGVWTNRTVTQVKSDLGITGSNTGDQDLSGLQPLDSDLTVISALSPTDDDFLQRKSGAWANRTVTQVKSDLSLSGTNTGDQTLPVKCTGAEIDTGTDDAKFATAKAINDSHVWRPETTGQINSLTGKTTPVDADMLVIDDSAASNAKKKLTWANLKATVKTYYDSVTATLTNKTISGTANTLNHVVGGTFLWQSAFVAGLTEASYYTFTGSTAAPALNITTVHRCFVPRAITIRAISFFARKTTAASSENVTVNIQVDGTTDYSCGTMQWTTAGFDHLENTSLNGGAGIQVAAGHYVQMKITLPTWATDPVNIWMNAVVEYTID